MGQGRLATTACVLALLASARPAAQSNLSATSEAVLEYFSGHTNESIDALLGRLRPSPLDADARERVIAGLPTQGALQPTPAELRKIAAAGRVLDYYARHGVIAFKVIELNHGYVGLYERTVVLASRYALALVTGEEFAALVAHEMAHEMVWAEYAEAMQRQDHVTMQHLELHCDGLAVLTLRRVGISPERLISAVRTITRFNQWRRATVSAVDYVPLPDRIAFIRAMARLEFPNAVPAREHDAPRR